MRARGLGTGMLTLRPAEAAWEGMPDIPPPMGVRALEAAAEWVVVVRVGAMGSAGNGVVIGAGDGVDADGVDLGEF